MMRGWIDRVVLDLARQMRWSFLPPLMVYFAAGLSGLTAITGAFFVKEYLDLSATALATLAFWVGLPWALKMPLGHLVDLIWRWKAWLVFLGAGLIAGSVLIMYALLAHRTAMEAIMPVNAWFATSALLAPFGYVVQDAVADAMSIDAVPRAHPDGTPLTERESKALHTTMQTLGRIALIGGLVLVAALNIVMFEGVEAMDPEQKAAIYRRLYLFALAIPLTSISGVLLALVVSPNRTLAARPAEKTEFDARYFIGGGLFVALAAGIGLWGGPGAQEMVFAGSLSIVLFLMRRMVRRMPHGKALALFGTALIIFCFRAMPLPGAGLTWFEIDVLGFDQRFLSVLSLITSILTLAGMIALRPLIARKSISWIVVMLTLAAGVLALPNIGLYYGLHEWTAARTGGIVDARFIAILDAAAESPLNQIAMVPMLAWIAKNAPEDLKATFFAVMASFTNLALSASSLGTRYLNQFFVVTREVRDPASGSVLVAADYDALGSLLLTVAGLSFATPLLVVVAVNAAIPAMASSEENNESG